jgi:hypothetical protein
MSMLEQKAMADGVIVTSLSTSPAWAPWLADLNQLLTTMTLIAGLTLGLARLLVFLRERRSALLASKRDVTHEIAGRDPRRQG